MGTHIFWGIVDGQSTSKAFSVRMDLHHTFVDDLKKRVKEVKSPMFDHLPADELKLSKVAITDDPDTELDPIELRYLSSHTRLRATERLSKAFGNNWRPTDGTIYFIVHRPEAPSLLPQYEDRPSQAYSSVAFMKREA
ncbi:hypothetical protein BG006_010599 [Podila minutissima]|uniref:Crinkler effector protein N-terminal domain-containing protein n=1 Tax=Podila minutissima TaxID=64525 RepID=A0A9P5VQ19_9FUNG|nr:hypothetical protein BG006_010599 [Podila minutissima]